MKTSTQDTVQRLWNLCNVLRDDGITYHQYVTELVFLLFLKMAKETGQEKSLPRGWRWDDILQRESNNRLGFYKSLLKYFGTVNSKRVRTIFEGASTYIRRPESLSKLVDSIDSMDWFSFHKEELGDLYEGLLEKNASELKSGAGQYFTPRALVDCMVSLVKPKAGELIQDPAAGTGGFLIAARRHTTADRNNLAVVQQGTRRSGLVVGVELVPETRRLALMNLVLHNIDGEIHLEDTLSPFGQTLAKADVILTNPPFGAKQGGGRPSRDDFEFPTSNKQLSFVEHVLRGLKAGGRAAIVVPDNVLFEENIGCEIRRELMDQCNLHTILRLPTGIFYAQGVKTNVMFFSRGETETGNTVATWIYNMRTNMPSFGKRRRLEYGDFSAFIGLFGEDPYGRSNRAEDTEGRWQCVTREEIRNRGDNLDIPPFREEGVPGDEPEGPDEIAVQMLEKFEMALGELRGLFASLKDES